MSETSRDHKADNSQLRCLHHQVWSKGLLYFAFFFFLPQIHIDRQGEDLVANLVGELKAQGSPADRRNSDVKWR